ncbi:MAG: hypothetical protein J6Z35_05645 [Lachnospiraceae bacterium]|nr:hypothetical protein [Lachnospiraceae bacterium]
MGAIFEIIAELILELITDASIEIVSGSEETRHWPKAVKILLAVVAFLVFAAMFLFLTVIGVALLTEGKIAIGMLLVVLALLGLVVFALRIRGAYKRRWREK